MLEGTPSAARRNDGDGADVDSIGHWVGGRRTPGRSGRVAPVFDPALGVQTKTVDLASAGETEAVVQCAVGAAVEWQQSPLGQRTDRLFHLRELLAARRDDLAVLVSQEHGKVLSDAAGEVARGLECVEFACGVAQML